VDASPEIGNEEELGDEVTLVGERSNETGELDVRAGHVGIDRLVVVLGL
jgi:hypothetical protein